MVFKTFGLLPASVILGHIVDKSCNLWQNFCNKKGRCFDYDIPHLSVNISIFGVALSGMSIVHVTSAVYLEKTSEDFNIF